MEVFPTTTEPLVDTTNRANAVILPTFSFLAILITYLPFKSFYRNRNFPACNIVFLVTVQNILIFVNAIIWPNGDWAAWWNGVGLCDVQGYLKIPLTTGIATSFAAFTRTLANAIDVDQHNFIDTPAMRRRALLFDVLICWTVPLLQIALYYVIQVSRFVILPVYGCGVYLDSSWVTIVVMYIPAPLFSLYSAYEAALILYRLRKHRANLSRALSSNNSGYTTRRYIKLFMIALFLIVVVLPIEFFYLSLNIPPEFVPYSWSRIHNSAIWPTIIYLSTSDVPSLQYNGWISVALSVEIFVFFGFNDDAIDAYRRWLVLLGFGKIWPTLKESREARRLRRRGSQTQSGLRSRLDLVGKAVKYFDGQMKTSQTPSAAQSECGQSRKNSHATSSTIALSAINSNTPSPESGKSSMYRTFSDTTIDNVISPAPSPLGPITSLTPIQEVAHTSQAPLPKKPDNVLTSWRTILNLPVNLFATKQTNTEPHSETPNSNVRLNNIHDDIESQRQVPEPRSSMSEIVNPPGGTTISTTIWSDPSPLTSKSNTKTTTTQSETQISEFPLPNSAGVTDDLEDDLHDPLSPKLGSRAYRERERREMERDRAEQEALRKNSQ